MSGYKRPPKSNQPSIAYGLNPVRGGPFALADFLHHEHVPTVAGNNKQSGGKSEPLVVSHELLSTSELVSAVGQIWNFVSPPAVFQQKGKLNRSGIGCWENFVLGDLSGEEAYRAPALNDDGEYYCIDVRTASHITPMVQPKFALLRVTQKMSVLGNCSNNYVQPLLWKFFGGGTNLSNETWKGEGLANVGISYELEKIYGWMRKLIPAGSQYPVNITEIEKEKIGKSSISESAISNDGCISGDTIHPASIFASKRVDCFFDSVKLRDTSLCDNTKVGTEIGTTSSLCSDYLLGDLQENNVNASVARTPGSILRADYFVDFLAPCKHMYENFQHSTDDNEVPQNTRKEPERFVTEDKYAMEIRSLALGRTQYAFAKQEHAFAGASAGIFVSLCLHPIDTVKTVIQSCRAEHKSIYYIGRSIVSERGVTGLYRGIASNIASSAPISAIYTFTYESVKGSLLPLFLKEYHSFAHCIAGGCASIATSFVFTPSERIKQQMQIGSHYHNCWSALIGIIRKGGLQSLYAGWGAVLCRNVPHSIIKFYTYESLKQMMLPSQSSNVQPNTLQTLVCGGLAGSTAAIFTTPFDVVKTRLQTQIPGSMSQYDSVFHALQEIAKNEGLKGLYRGLIPRLVMYMSQGALFFASYEFFKRLFCLEVPQLAAQRIQYKENKKDNSTPLQLKS